MKILAIGERFNGPAWVPDDPYDFKLRVECGLYNHGSRRDFLDRVGVHWTHGINLLWPDPIPGAWDVVEARDAAEQLHDYIEQYDRVLLFGEKVCDAFNIPYKPGLVFGIYVPLHHPVGDMSIWNKRFIKEILE